MNSNCGHPLYWPNCYTGSFDLLTEESVAHPAKMSPALCYRILEHLEELGLLKEDSTILDPMAGTGMTNLCAGAKGYKTIGVELEPKFIGFQEKNKEYVEKRIYRELDWQILQGDSRRLSELLVEKGLVSVTSPPYFQAGNEANDNTVGIRGRDFARQRMGDTDGQIANLPDKGLVSITSPPYQDVAIGNGIIQRNRQVVAGLARENGAERKNERYGKTEGQIGNLKDAPLKTIVSPPYSEALKDTGAERLKIRVGKGHPADYSGNEENIGNLKDIPLKTIVSPPYGNPRPTSEEYDDKYDLRRPPGVKWGRESFRGRYGETEGQIGDLENKPLKTITSPPYEDSDVDGARKSPQGYFDQVGGIGHTKTIPTAQMGKGETYLSAMLQVYSEIAKVSDVLVVVVKNPTRNGKLRRLDTDTKRIMELAGWKIHCRHRALLFEELEQETLFGEKTKRVKGRMSFFKRLAWDKGSPVASWEDIIISVR